MLNLKMETNENLQRLAALDDAEQNDHDGNDQQDVNESADGVAGHETKQPEDQENDSDSVKHDFRMLRLDGKKG